MQSIAPNRCYVLFVSFIILCQLSIFGVHAQGLSTNISNVKASTLQTFTSEGYSKKENNFYNFDLTNTRYNVINFMKNDTYKNRFGRVSYSRYDKRNRLKRALRSTNAQKTLKTRGHGRKSQKKSSGLVGIRDYGPSQVETTLTALSPLCPVWPNDPHMNVVCTDGRKLQSVCAVTCTNGYKLREGAPRKRRCRFRRNKATKRLRVAWSGRNDLFQCVSECKIIPNPNNGQIVCGYNNRNGSIRTRLNRSCVVICDPGYKPSSMLPRYCQQDGTWSGFTLTCQASPPTKEKSLFTLNHRIDCGNVKSITTFTRHNKVFLVAGDTTDNLIRVYRWTSGHFEHWQIFQTFRPLVVEVLQEKQHYRLLVGNENTTAFYILNEKDKFIFARRRMDYSITSVISQNEGPTEGISMMRYNSDIYRCKGHHDRNNRSIMIVHKFVVEKGSRPHYERIMRKKFHKFYSMSQCSMFVSHEKLHAVASLNRSDGQGKILFGVADHRRMRTIQSITSNNLQHLSDNEVFKSVEGKNYFVVAQSLHGGQCFIFEETSRGFGAS